MNTLYLRVICIMGAKPKQPLQLSELPGGVSNTHVYAHLRVLDVGTGCSLNIVFFSKILKYIPNSGLSRFPLGVSVWTQWQVKHQRCSRTCRVKNHNISKKNTILTEHPVQKSRTLNRLFNRLFPPISRGSSLSSLFPIRIPNWLLSFSGLTSSSAAKIGSQFASPFPCSESLYNRQ